MGKKRVGIIGAGIVGTALGHYLSKYDNVAVTIFEKSTIGSGTTAKSAGTVCLLDDSVTHEFWDVRLHGFQTYLAMEAEEKGSTGFQKTGTLVVVPNAAVEEYTKTAIGLSHKAGYQAAWIGSHDEIRRIIPDLNLEGIIGAAWTGDDGYFDATMISNTFARKARANGVRILINTPVTKILMASGRVTGVETPKGTHELDVVVDASGPWSRYVTRQVGLDLPIWHTKAEVFVLRPTVNLGYPFPILKYPRFYARDERDSIFICRAHVTMDLGKPMEAGLFNPDDLPMTGGTEAYFWEFLTDQLLENYPRLLESSIANDWVGYRAETPDFIPIAGDTPVEGYLLAAGCGGNGVIEAPSMGRDLAEYIAAGRKSSLLERLSLSRFDGKHRYLVR